MMETSKTALSRRSFVAGASCAAVATGAAAVTARAQEAASEGGATFADTVAWNAEYDVVVVGFGGAGGVSAIYAADNGARVLLTDAAPYGEEGGNTRFACQMMVTGVDPDRTFEYYRDVLAWHFDVDEKTLRTYTDSICNMVDYVKYLGAEEPHQWYEGGGIMPEYPEGGVGEGTIIETFVHDGCYDSGLWKLIRKNVLDRAGMIDVWYSAPAVHLVQDPDTKTIVGVQIDKDGQTVLVRALNGVVMACGGFECNKRMIQDYLGCARLFPIGGLHNNGDGHRMVMEVGADLWHMDAYESLGILSGNGWAVEEGGRVMLEPKFNARVSRISMESNEYGNGSVFMVGDDGSRFVNESVVHRHGHVPSCGVWRNPIANYTPHLIFDQAQYDYLVESGRIDDERAALVVSADSPEELAEKIGADPEVLATTLADFNFFVESGRDYQFNRDLETMRALEGDKLYAIELRPAVLNTQGGPRHNERAEVLDVNGEVIPHLYCAGEFGGMTAFQYNSGGNLAECMVFGSISGTNAASEKDPLPADAKLDAVDDDILYTAGSASDEPVALPAVELGENDRLGTSSLGMGDELTLKVTVEDGKVTAVEPVVMQETPEYGAKVIGTLVQEAIEAGSADIDVVSTATMTSAAFIQALANAIEG